MPDFQSYIPTTVRDQRSFIFSQVSSCSGVIPTLIQPASQGVLLQAQWHLLALPMLSLNGKIKEGPLEWWLRPKRTERETALPCIRLDLAQNL